MNGAMSHGNLHVPHLGAKLLVVAVGELMKALHSSDLWVWGSVEHKGAPGRGPESGGLRHGLHHILRVV